MNPRWGVIVAEVPDALADELAFVLGRDGLGVELEPAAAATTRLKAYWAQAQARPLPIEAAADALRAFGLDPDACGLHSEAVEDGRWVERYQATLKPLPLGERFVIVPGDTWPEPSGRRIVRVVPGMAFGTGEHATTRQCGAALERLVEPGSAWLDLGTGSGILAMIAKLCGAATVVAVDVDAAAVEVAREGFEANGLGDGLEAREGSIDGLEGSGFDGVAANIFSSFFLRHSPKVAAALRPGGVLVAAGFLTDDLPEIREAFAAAGLRIRTTGAEGPWALVEAERV
jgi:ribosomal protein L11 methyltransferase